MKVAGRGSSDFGVTCPPDCDRSEAELGEPEAASAPRSHASAGSSSSRSRELEIAVRGAGQLAESTERERATSSTSLKAPYVRKQVLGLPVLRSASLGDPVDGVGHREPKPAEEKADRGAGGAKSCSYASLPLSHHPEVQRLPQGHRVGRAGLPPHTARR